MVNSHCSWLNHVKSTILIWRFRQKTCPRRDDQKLQGQALQVLRIGDFTNEKMPRFEHQKSSKPWV